MITNNDNNDFCRYYIEYLLITETLNKCRMFLYPYEFEMY